MIAPIVCCCCDHPDETYNKILWTGNAFALAVAPENWSDEEFNYECDIKLGRFHVEFIRAYGYNDGNPVIDDEHGEYVPGIRSLNEDTPNLTFYVKKDDPDSIEEFMNEIPLVKTTSYPFPKVRVIVYDEFNGSPVSDTLMSTSSYLAYVQNLVSSYIPGVFSHMGKGDHYIRVVVCGREY